MNRTLLSAVSTLAVAGASLCASAATPAPLDDARAQSIVDAFYGALTAPTRDAIVRGLAPVVDPAWRNCGGDDACQDLAATIQRWTARIDVVPDMQWQRHAVLVAGDHVVVRGEVRGTPRATFLGLAPTGQSFRVMTIDIHTVHDGRIVETRHLEDWAAAMRRLAPPSSSGTASK